MTFNAGERYPRGSFVIANCDFPVYHRVGTTGRKILDVRKGDIFIVTTDNESALVHCEFGVMVCPDDKMWDYFEGENHD